MTRADRIRLLHMIEGAEQACCFVEGRSRADLEADVMLRMALLYAVRVVGEAASRVSGEAQDALSDVPWTLIVGMRHRLVHGYMDVDHDILWDTVTERLPPLIRRLREIPDLTKP